MKANVLPDIYSLREKLAPDFDNGTLTWKTAGPRQQYRIGKLAGVVNSQGYVKITVEGKQYAAHRLLWYMYYGHNPPDILDHIDRNPLNNSISNLRAATPALNSQNRGVASNNTSGVPGISWHKTRRRYIVTKMIDKKDNYIGEFLTMQEAVKALNDWCEKNGITCATNADGHIPRDWLD